MQIAEWIAATEVEGPGLRCALWLQGCPIRCQNCCNPQYFSPQGGESLTPEAVAARILARPVQGLTLLGGEPLAQAAELKQLLTLLRAESELDIWCFSGYVWEVIQSEPLYRAVVALCDMVIAGPFDHRQRPDKRRWIGSRNQTVHPISPRAQAFAAHWPERREEIEIHLRADGSLVLNGSPWPTELLTLKERMP